MEDGVLKAKIDTREEKSYFINVINNLINHKDEITFNTIVNQQP